jgi:hypothetical protein
MLLQRSLTFDITQSDSGERSVLLRATVLVIASKKVHMNMCLILNGYGDIAIMYVNILEVIHRPSFF